MMAGIIIPSKEENATLLGGIKPSIIEPAERLLDIMMKEKLLTADINPSDLIDTHFADCYQQ